MNSALRRSSVTKTGVFVYRPEHLFSEKNAVTSPSSPGLVWAALGSPAPSTPGSSSDPLGWEPGKLGRKTANTESECCVVATAGWCFFCHLLCRSQMLWTGAGQKNKRKVLPPPPPPAPIWSEFEMLRKLLLTLRVMLDLLLFPCKREKLGKYNTVNGRNWENTLEPCDFLKQESSEEREPNYFPCPLSWKRSQPSDLDCISASSAALWRMKESIASDNLIY